MNAELLARITSTGAIFDLSSRAKWSLSGSDRVRYLNGQTTNDIRQARADATLYACVTDAKGRIVGDLHIHDCSAAHALFCDAEPELHEVLGPRLERYIIADDAELVDISDDWQLYHVTGAQAIAAARAVALPQGAYLLNNEHRLHQPGLDLWLPSQHAGAAFLQTITPCVDSLTDLTELQTLRCIPRYPSELNGEAFPAEAGLEARAMSFTKGCYIGQEVLSRIKTTGKMPRVLVAWQSETPLNPGDAWFAASDVAEQANAIGHATSAVFHPQQQRWRGLGYVKQAFAPSDSVLPLRTQQPRLGPIVEIFALPKQ